MSTSLIYPQNCITWECGIFSNWILPPSSGGQPRPMTMVCNFERIFTASLNNNLKRGARYWGPFKPLHLYTQVSWEASTVLVSHMAFSKVFNVSSSFVRIPWNPILESHFIGIPVCVMSVFRSKSSWGNEKRKDHLVQKLVRTRTAVTSSIEESSLSPTNKSHFSQLSHLPELFLLIESVLFLGTEMKHDFEVMGLFLASSELGVCIGNHGDKK